MANLVPVDYDPFAAPAQAGGAPKLVPVDHDPFAEQPAVSPNMGFAPRAVRETAEPVSVMQAISRGGAQGPTFGFADEMNAAAAASPLPGASAMPRLAIPNAVDTIAGGVRLLAEKVAPSYFGTEGSQIYEKEAIRRREELAQAREQQPLAAYGSEIVGGLLAPLGAAGQAATRGQAALQGARAGAVGGALYGAGQGEDMSSRATGAAQGAVVGGVLGGALGGVIGPGSGAAAAQVGPTGQDIAAASERIGVQVPKAIATDSVALQRAAQGARNVPFAGDPLVKATDNMVQGLGRAADDVAAGLGSADRATSGTTASSAIKDWITGKSKAVVTQAYDAVDNVVDPAVRSPLSSTQQTIADILSRRQNANIQGDSRAVNEVLAAAQNPNGLNFAGIKDLRTRIGELQSSGILPADMSGKELKQIYGALSDDLKTAAANAGGQRGLQLFERANRLNAAVAQRREELAKIVGKNGDAPAEQVFDTIVRFAGEKGGADIARLAKARNAIGGDWDEVVSGVVARMGRDAEGNFTPDRFVTAWGNLSDAGKSVMFSNSAHRAALEDIAAISSKAKDLYKKFGNPSGTAQNVGGGALVAGLLAEPISTIGAVVGGNVLSRALAQPATASSMARWSRAYQVAVTKPTAATAATLQVATRNLSATIGDQLGVKVLPQEILKAIAGPGMRSSAASEQDPGNDQ
ncbi:hypothetical protein Pam5_13 [Pseudanabaena phage Pam5]|nr:hypothetical protein Pam5_13 [Pseudanabaena phage Pam5]